jgi:DNA polymerase-1
MEKGPLERSLFGEGPADAPASVGPSPPDPELVTTAEDFGRVLAATEGAPIVGLDTETTGLDPHADRVRTVQIAVADRVWVVDAFTVGALAPVRQWLEARAKAGHCTVLFNAKFDLKMLRAALGGAPLLPVAVTDLMHWSVLLACGLHAAGGHGLAAVAERWLGLRLPKEERLGDWSGQLRPEQVAYAARDAWALVPLAEALRPRLQAEGLTRVAAVEDACVPAVADMEFAGLAFDLPYWRRFTDQLEASAARAGAEVRRLLDTGGPTQMTLFGEPADALNLNSVPQLREALRAAGIEAASTSEHALRPFAADHPAVAALLEYKKLSKLQSAFGEALPRFVHPSTGRIHAHYHQLGHSGIGRFACADPNIQQIPRDLAVRRAFVAGAGRRLVVADLSQIELRVMARLSGDTRMLEAYRRGEDLHRLTASLIAGVPVDQVTKDQRQLAKAANFGLIYAMSAMGLRGYAAASYGVRMTQEEAETFRRRFFEAYPGVAAYHRRQGTEARRAREVRTLLGRAHRWPDTRIGLPELVNLPSQGTGADILKRAMGLLRQPLAAAGADLVASVHDELLVDCPADRADEVRSAVHDALVAAGGELLDPVPVEADAVIGDSWADKA